MYFPVPFWLTFAVARAHPIAIDPDSLSGWRLLEDCRARLETSAAGFTLPPSPFCAEARRHLALAGSLSLFLFGLLNPIVRTLRALGAASKVRRIQEEVRGRAVSQLCSA